MDCRSPFLAEERREALMQRLAENDVPFTSARRLANAPHNLRMLDEIMAALVKRLLGHCEVLSDAVRCGNTERQEHANRRLACDLAVFRAYTGEAVERGLGRELFPLTNKAIEGRAQA